jgi:hypothetical protein
MNRKSESMLFKRKLGKRSCLTIKGDTTTFLKTYKLIADRENRPFLDVLNHQMGVL